MKEQPNIESGQRYLNGKFVNTISADYLAELISTLGVDPVGPIKVMISNLQSQATVEVPLPTKIQEFCRRSLILPAEHDKLERGIDQRAG